MWKAEVRKIIACEATQWCTTAVKSNSMGALSVNRMKSDSARLGAKYHRYPRIVA